MLTLADMAQLSVLSPFTRTVIYSMLSHSRLFDRLPFDDTGDLNTMIMEATGLPTPSHRALNPASINVATAQFGQRTEALKIMSDQIKVDRQLRNNRSSVIDPRTAAIEQYTKAAAYEVVDQFINGNPVITPDEPGGMAFKFLTDTRLSDGTPNPATQKQVIDANKINRDLTAAGDQLALLNSIHELITLIDGGNPDVLITNRQGVLAIGAVARAQRMLMTTRDMFGRSVNQFGDGGPEIIDAGYPPASVFTRASQVLPTAASGGDDLVTDAIYAVKFGTSQVGGLQKQAPEAVDFAEDASSFPQIISAFEWVYGFHVTNPFAVAVLRRAF